ncbi:MAG: hypothetical protein EOO05_11820 [Chitinophagaceae bacterium]|nr:MAG: hypothetical protein EOO05_11820 [Chitinophagaceae bacterium]
MKKLIIATAIAGLFLASCNKANKDELYPATTDTTAAGASTVTASGWVPVSFTAGSQTGKGLTAYSGALSTSAVNDEVLESGLVLVFGKTNAAVSLLPFQDGNVEWSYSVSNGEVSVIAVSSKEVTAASVLTVVLPAAKIAELEKTGYSKSDLLNIPYEKAQSLFGL